jgi:hypothetical protein
LNFHTPRALTWIDSTNLSPFDRSDGTPRFGIPAVLGGENRWEFRWSPTTSFNLINPDQKTDKKTLLHFWFNSVVAIHKRFQIPRKQSFEQWVGLIVDTFASQALQSLWQGGTDGQVMVTGRCGLLQGVWNTSGIRGNCRGKRPPRLRERQCCRAA